MLIYSVLTDARRAIHRVDLRSCDAYGPLKSVEGGQPSNGTVAMTDRNKLDELDRRIAAAQAARQGAPSEESKYQKANLAWQMVIELVAGMLIGLGIGWSLDWLFGTVPLFLAIFSILGFAAGVRTMMRTARRVQDRAAQARQD